MDGENNSFSIMPIASGIVIAGGVAFVALLLYRKYLAVRANEQDSAQKFISIPISVPAPKKKTPQHA